MLSLLLSSNVSAMLPVLQTAFFFARQPERLQRQSSSFSAWEAAVLQKQQKATNTAQKYAACIPQSTQSLPATITRTPLATCSTSMFVLQAKTLMSSTAALSSSMAFTTAKAWLEK